MRRVLTMSAVSMLAAITIACEARRTISEIPGVSTLGAASAPIVLVYFTDYRCTDCQEFTSTTLPTLKPFIDAGRLRLVLAEVAIDSEPRAAALAARCAQEFGKYWPYVEALSENRPDSLGLNEVAVRANVPADPFARCVAADRYSAALQQAADAASQLGVHTAPAMVLGPATQRLKPEELRRGDLSAAVIDSLLKHEFDLCGC